MNFSEINNLPRPTAINPGDQIFYEEDVFFKHEKRHVFAGKRKAVVRVIGAGIPGNFIVEIVRCKGVNAFPEGAKIEKPEINLLRGFLINDFKKNPSFKSGGHLEGVDEGGKKVALDSADRGGMSVGSTHADGGIKGKVAGSKDIEFENKEPVITSEVNNDSRVDTFEGKQMSPRQVLSEINVKNGGKAFAEGGETGTENKPVGFKGGEIILTAPVSDDQTQYDYNGRKRTALQIASEINERNKGVKITAKDGTVVDCPCNH
jgi:hypothetical protein